MAEETQTVEQTTTTTETQVVERTPFDLDEPTVVSEKVEEKVVEKKKEEVSITDDTLISIPVDWLKKEFNVDDPAVLKAEREELKKLKETPAATEYKYENEESERMHKAIVSGDKKVVKQILEKQERLESLTTSEVTKDNATDIIKMGLQERFKDLTAEEINFKFNKEYALPKEPVYNELAETEDEFKVKHDEWKEKCKDIETSKIIDAKQYKPELEKLKAELVLPEIKKEETTTKKPTQEDLDAFEKSKSSFLQLVETSLNGFSGFTSQVKDKDVDYTVSYAPSQEEKTFVSEKIKNFAESGFDANALLADRWVSEDGKSINVDQMVKDLSRVYSDDKAVNKLVSDAANKRLEAYLKDKKKIDFNGQTPQGTFQPTKDGAEEMDKVRENAFSV